MSGNGRPRHHVFVLDSTLFHWKGRMYRVNEELIFRPHEYTDGLEDQDLEALAHDWKIHPAVDEEAHEEDVPAIVDDEEDLEDLPYDTSANR